MKRQETMFSAGFRLRNKIRVVEEIPGVPVVRTLCFHCKGHELNFP